MEPTSSIPAAPTSCAKCGCTCSRPPLCDPCREQAVNYPYPDWLRYALIALLCLLPVAFWRGSPYFSAGRSLARGERLLAQRKYADAAIELENAVKIAPTADRARLLAVKAHVLNGDAGPASILLDEKNHFETDELVTEVAALMGRVERASQKVDQAEAFYANKQFDQGKNAYREAAAAYPESKDIPEQAELGDAFARSDFDKMLAITKAASERTRTASSVAAVASALACKFASTGDPDYEKQARETLAQARLLATTPQTIEAFHEYSERIEFRLRTREIIGLEEYNRRFRPKASQEKK